MPDRLTSALDTVAKKIFDRRHVALLDPDRQRIRCPVGIVAIAVEGRGVLAARVEEIQRDAEVAGLFVRDRADKPVVAVTVLAGEHDVVADLTVEGDAFLPVCRHVLDEPERIRPCEVILGQVGRHLHGAV